VVFVLFCSLKRNLDFCPHLSFFSLGQSFACGFCGLGASGQGERFAGRRCNLAWGQFVLLGQRRAALPAQHGNAVA